MLTEPASSPVSWLGSGTGDSAVTDLKAGPQGSVEIDANLLFLGHYARDHADLVISDGHHAVRVHDYFGPGGRPVLRSADGGSLPEATIAGLVAAGLPLQVAETEGGEARPESRPVGRVETADGGASALRNGVTVTLRPGDPVYKGDVLQTDDSGHLAVTFIDGTAFNLDGESRMVVDGMNYQQGAAGNSALFSLVQGAITFVAGQTAKTGDMKVATPTATMGIRGTAVHVEIASDRGTVKFSVMTEPDGHTGRYDVYANGDPEHVLFTVSDPGVATTVTPNAQGQLSVVSASKSPTDMAREDALVKGVFATVASGQQHPIIQAPTEAPTLHPNPPTSSPAGGSSSPPSLILPDKGFAPPATPAAPEQPANHSQADPTTTGSIVRTVATTATSETASSAPAAASFSTAIVSTAVAEAHGATVAAGVIAASFVPTGVALSTPAIVVATGVSTSPATFLGSGAPAGTTAPGASATTTLSGTSATTTGSVEPTATSNSDTTVVTTGTPAPAGTVDATASGTVASQGAASPALTVAGPLHAVATLGGHPITMDLLTGVTGGDQGATLTVADLSYASGQEAASQTLPVGVSLTGSSLTLDPSLLAGRGASGGTGTVTIGFDISDGHGGTVHQSLIVTLTSPSVGPSLVPDTAPHILSEKPGITAGPAILSAAIPLGFTDPDLGEAHGAAVALSGAVWSNGPVLPTGLSATLAKAASVGLTETDRTGMGHVTLAFAAPDKAFDFLAAGETLQATYAVSVTDASGDVSTTPVSLTIVGANDAPVFDGAPVSTVLVVASGSNPGPGPGPGPGGGPGPGAGSTVAQTSGSLHFVDPDLSDRPTASVLKQSVIGYDAGHHALPLTPIQIAALEKAFSFTQSGASSGTVDWTYKIADPALASLAQGQTIQVVSTILLDDHHGGTTMQDVVVNLTGPTTGPDAQPDIDGVMRGGMISADAAHGVLANDTATGPGPGLMSIVSAAGASGSQLLLPTLLGPLPGLLPGLTLPGILGPLHTDVVGTYGTLALASDGSYAYTADHAPPIGANGVLQDVFTYTVADQQGHTATSTLTFTIVDSGVRYAKPAGLNDGTSHILIGVTGPTVLDGGNGDDRLIAVNGPTVMIGGPGDDILTGGSAPSTFVFNAGFGHDTIREFEADHDILQFGHDIFSSTADVLAHATDQATGLLIADASGDSLLLLDMTKQTLATHLAAIHIV
jgi:VCBS repeat-containing protein